MFGPVRRVRAYGTIVQRTRVRSDGGTFDLASPDFTVAALELESGVVVRLTATFWVGPGKQRGLELHGDEGSLYLASWAEFDSRLERSSDGVDYEPLPFLRDPYPGIDWARALVDLAEALDEARPHRAGAEHAAHVVEALDAVAASSRDGGTVEVRSSFPAPPPLDWAR